MKTWSSFSSVFLRLALGFSFLSAVADRFGWWGAFGQPNVAWGNFAGFVGYTGKLNWFPPRAMIPTVAVLTGRVIYPSHASAPAILGLTPLRDQECAGALMWFWVTIAYLLPAVAITLRMLSPSKPAERAWFVHRVGP